MKNQKGITLIALVITIIVLLILAGVSIAMLAGDNGVLTKASDSKIVNALGAKKDEVALVAAEGLSDYYESIYLNNTTSSRYEKTALIQYIVDKINDTQKGVKSDADVTITCSTDGIEIKSIAKPDTLYTNGTFTTEGALTWVDHFKAD